MNPKVDYLEALAYLQAEVEEILQVEGTVLEIKFFYYFKHIELQKELAQKRLSYREAKIPFKKKCFFILAAFFLAVLVALASLGLKSLLEASRGNLFLNPWIQKSLGIGAVFFIVFLVLFFSFGKKWGKDDLANQIKDLEELSVHCENHIEWLENYLDQLEEQRHTLRGLEKQVYETDLLKPEHQKIVPILFFKKMLKEKRCTTIYPQSPSLEGDNGENPLRDQNSEALTPSSFPNLLEKNKIESSSLDALSKLYEAFGAQDPKDLAQNLYLYTQFFQEVFMVEWHGLGERERLLLDWAKLSQQEEPNFEKAQEFSDFLKRTKKTVHDIEKKLQPLLKEYREKEDLLTE